MLPFRPNVCMLVYSPQFYIWIGERFGATTWQLPQGGVNTQKPLRDSVVRELNEELGLHLHHLGQITQLEATHCYKFQRTPPRWRNRWSGQEQTFWAVEFLGHDKDINLTSHHPQEFARWAWCPPDQLLERVEPVRRPGYQRPLSEFLAKIVQL